jgi:hypothetical protein
MHHFLVRRASRMLSQSDANGGGCFPDLASRGRDEGASCVRTASHYLPAGSQSGAIAKSPRRRSRVRLQQPGRRAFPVNLSSRIKMALLSLMAAGPTCLLTMQLGMRGSRLHCVSRPPARDPSNCIRYTNHQCPPSLESKQRPQSGYSLKGYRSGVSRQEF